jgi:para-aminobenzoate synthetase component 1
MDFYNDYRAVKYAALLNNNLHKSGFEPMLLTGTEAGKGFDGGGGFFFCNYDHKNKIESLVSKNRSPLLFDDLLFFVPENKISFRDQNNIGFPSKEGKIKISLVGKTSKEEYITTVKKLKEHIQNGDIYEINYCITFEACNVKIDPVGIYKKLNDISLAPYSALVKLDNKYIISASPELFLSKRGNKLISKPIKGTIKRGATPEEDEKLKSELFNSIKERTENVMIVDVVRNDLSRLAKKASVEVEKLYDIETYSQVHQMVSTISCELKENPSFTEIINATFPMASMTGAPKIRAMELIDEFETYSRGPYSGCMGYIKENGDFDLSVLIRSIFYNESENYLSFSVGSAITALCDPEKEYEECLLKAAALKKVLED